MLRRICGLSRSSCGIRYAFAPVDLEVDEHVDGGDRRLGSRDPVTSVTRRPAAASAASTAASTAGSSDGGAASGPRRVRMIPAAKPGSIRRIPSSTAATSAPSGPTISQGRGQRIYAVDRHPAPGGLEATMPQQAAGSAPNPRCRCREPRPLPRPRPQRPSRSMTPRNPPRIRRVRRRARPRIRPDRRPAQLGQVGLAGDPGSGPPGRRDHGRVRAAGWPVRRSAGSPRWWAGRRHRCSP